MRPPTASCVRLRPEVRRSQRPMASVARGARVSGAGAPLLRVARFGAGARELGLGERVGRLALARGGQSLGLAALARSPRVSGVSNRTETSFETPGSCMVTP